MKFEYAGMPIRLSFIRSTSMLCIVAAGLFATDGAYAQGVSLPDPDFPLVSAENVDPVSGSLTFDVPEFSMGDKGDPLPIDFIRTYRTPTYTASTNIDPFGENWSHNYVIGAHYMAGSIGSNGHTMNVVAGKDLYLFSAVLSGGNWSYSSLKQDGATAESVNISGTTTTVLTTFNGYKYYFPQDNVHAVSNTYDEGTGSYSVLTAMVDKIVAPNGEMLNFVYSITGTSTLSNRLDAIKHSRGYGVIFKYLAAAGSGARSTPRQTIQQVVLADTLCSTFPYGCDESSFRKFNYAYSSYFYYRDKYVLASSTNPASEVTRYEHVTDETYYGNNRDYLRKIYTPADTSSASISFAYVDKTWSLEPTRAVGSVTVAGQTANFSYPVMTGTCTFTTSPPETIRTEPSGSVTRFRYFVWLEGEPDGIQWCAAPGGAVKEVQDPNGGTTKYGYGLYDTFFGRGGRNFLTKVTEPEGNYRYNTLDARGNITSTTLTPKAGSGLSNITSTATFPTCSTSNFRICNKPSYEIDGRGNRTDYEWSDGHGGQALVKRPTDAAGVRPETSIQYGTFTGVDGATFYLPTMQTDKISASESVVTNFEYSSSNGFRLRSKTVTAGGEMLRTCYGYDIKGRRISETKPAANLTTCP